MAKENIKKALHQKCVESVKTRIKNNEEAITAAQESANEETKSSSGDKYETGRAMMQQEVETLSHQLVEARKLEETLIHINPELTNKSVSKGALVITEMGNFYISVSAGKISVDGKDYFAIASSSPIGETIDGMKAGETYEWNGKKVKIKEVL